MTGVKISAIEYSLPKNREYLSNLKFINPKWNINKIYKATGIKKRYVSSVDEDIISLSIKSANKILKKFPKKKIDFIIFVTQTSPFKLPSASCIMQEKLNLKNDINAFDISMGCSGFIHALNIASNFIKNKQAKHGLIICADTYTKFINKNNSSCRPIFSDASCSILLSQNKDNCIGPFELGTDGRGAMDLNLSNNSNNIFMNGSKVALFSIKRVPKCIKELMKKNKIKYDKVDKFIFHQASKYVLDSLYKILKIDKSKIYQNYKNLGNTVSASIPIALKMASKQKAIKINNKIIITGFGVGLSWGSSLIKWKKII